MQIWGIGGPSGRNAVLSVNIVIMNVIEYTVKYRARSYVLRLGVVLHNLLK